MFTRSILTGFSTLIMGMIISGTEVLANPQTGQPTEWQLGFQRAVTPVMESISTLHNYVLILITLISLFVLGLLIYIVVRFNATSNPTPSNTTHHTLIEVLWTAIPILILVVMAIPSFKLLYFQDTVPEQVDLNIKATAYQWFWTYEYTDDDFEFDAFKLEPDEAEESGEPYLLATDTKVVVPVGKVVRVQITAADVIHAWAVPALGVKMDAYPGRLNEFWFQVDEPGVYYGQCSELCGQGHAFMPIAVEAMNQKDYEIWRLQMALEAMSQSDYEIGPSEAREEYARTDNGLKIADSSMSAMQTSHSE